LTVTFADPSKSNSISTVNIVNNLVTSSNSAVVLVGGEDKDGLTSGNTVQGVQLVNDTIENPNGIALDVTDNEDGGSTNAINSLSVVDCVLWGSVVGDVTASMITHSLLKQPVWARRNGNDL
jgi:hypothetical protein